MLETLEFSIIVFTSFKHLVLAWCMKLFKNNHKEFPVMNHWHFPLIIDSI
jgi:hypothetical protein